MSQLVNKVGTRSVVGTLAGSVNQLRQPRESCIRVNFREYNGGSFNENVNIFVQIFTEMFGPLVSSSCIQDAAGCSQPSRSVTMVSLILIKYDYSVIEL